MSNNYITEPVTEGKVCLETTVGEIDIELWSKECPLACENFLQLCMDGYYDGVVFHRLVKDFIVQTGDPTGTGHGGESATGGYFKSEFHQRLKFNRRGLLGMAMEDKKKNENGSQFFFTLGKADELNNKHTLFGKVVGDTLFNLLKLNELEVDQNERPTYLHKITGAKILSNPFSNLKPRVIKDPKKSKESRKKKDTSSKLVKKNTNLLSFGDEADEDDEQITVLSNKIKSKSAHDVLVDEQLSKERAVKPDEIGDYEDDDAEERKGRLDRIKKNLRAKKRKATDEETREGDEDYDQMINEQKELEKKAELEKISEEFKELGKEYLKAIRGPKESKIIDEEASTSAGMKTYKKLKLKFNSNSKGIVKREDPKRESQTLNLLERFQTKLARATVQGILTDKQVDMSDQMTQEEIILATSEDQGKIDLDAKDIAGEEWMVHALVAPEDTSVVTKAKDANMKEFNEEWYPIDDPRNIMNIRKREGLDL